MAIKTKTPTPASPSYVDVNPACELREEKGQDTLIIYLSDFKKEQIKVQVNKVLRVLYVSGERPSADGTKMTFFHQKNIPEVCDIKDISAKLIDGRVQVTMPKKFIQEQKDGSLMQRLQGSKKVALGFGVAIVTMVAIGAFVASKGSNNIESSILLCLLRKLGLMM